MDDQNGPYTRRQLYKRMKKKLKKRIEELEVELEKTDEVVVHLKSANEMQLKRIDWTVNDNAKKAIRIADLESKQEELLDSVSRILREVE